METARALAAAGAQVVLAGRDASRLDAAAATIRDDVPDAVLEIGLARPHVARQRARLRRPGTTTTHSRLHLLINNAGVMYTPLERTADGFEMQFGTNHVGHFLLTCLLVPQLLADPPSRVVNLSSGGHMGSDIVWDDPNFERREYDKFAAYGQSKTANILFSVELDRRLGDRGVHAYAVHPGMISTELGRYMTKDDFSALMERAKAATVGRACRRARRWSRARPRRCGRPPPPSSTPRAAPTSPTARSPTQHAPWARDPESAARLWTLTEDLVGERFPLD